MSIFGFGKKKKVPEKSITEPSSTEALDQKLTKTRARFRDGLLNFFLGNKPIDENLLEELEDQLIMADVGFDASQEVISTLSKSIARQSVSDAAALNHQLRELLSDILKPCEVPLEIPDTVRPYVILVVGVNGAGKTTTIGKLAKRLKDQNCNVMLAAGDTFRAAAVEQLQSWGARNQIPVVAQHPGADSAAVLYDAFESAKAKNMDVLIADTAGRLHTQSGLMDELKKVKRILGKLDPEAPHEILMVLDGGTGQNALNQAIQFNDALALTGLAITKLDGTAKGGIIFSVAKKLALPIRFIGVGEKAEDLRTFDAIEFVDALFSSPKN